MYYPARATIDCDALVRNYRHCQSLTSSKLMAIVKADAYGHGIGPVSAALMAQGARFFGVAQLGEALSLREYLRAHHFPHAHIMSWVYGIDAPIEEALTQEIDLSIGASWAFEKVCEAARKVGVCARVHLKVDTGMSRGGMNIDECESLTARFAAAQAEGVIAIVGLWSHLARGEEPYENFTAQQVAVFERARNALGKVGIYPQYEHLAASTGLLWNEKTHYSMVRPGALLYGISPDMAHGTAHALGFTPVMELSADVIVERTVPAGTGISYGHTDITDAPTHIGVIPVGYGDGIDRQASGRAPVVIGGERTHALGRICMDQFVVRLPEGVHPGQRAVLWGDDARGYPSADEWAEITGTIGWEVVTRLGPRVPREYIYRAKRYRGQEIDALVDLFSQESWSAQKNEHM